MCQYAYMNYFFLLLSVFDQLLSLLFLYISSFLPSFRIVAHRVKDTPAHTCTRTIILPICWVLIDTHSKVWNELMNLEFARLDGLKCYSAV